MSIVIPVLPKTMTEVIPLWRFGNQVGDILPTQNFRAAAQRNILIPNNTDHTWKNSGQKSAFAKYRKLLQIVSSLQERLQYTSCDVSQADLWNLATLTYHNTVDENGISRPLNFQFSSKAAPNRF